MKPKIITTLQAYSLRQFVADVIAGLILAMAILAVILLFGGLAGCLAMPALAALLLLTAWNMSEPNKWRGYLAAPNEERLLLLLTLVLTVFANLTIAIGAGVGIGLLLRWRKKQAPVGEWKVPDR